MEFMVKKKLLGAPAQGWRDPGLSARSQTHYRYSDHHSPIAAVLPAYNEAGRIGILLAVLRNVAEIQEIIVVDDGSHDCTGEEAFQAVALDPRIRVVRHERNLGKGAAMFTGSRQTRAPILVFLDSDLISLNPEQVKDLIRPVASGQADMSIGIFQGGKFTTDLSQRVTPWLSGQRCLRRSLLSQVSTRAAAGYGVETAITIAARQGNWQVVTVPLTGVSHPTGEVHRGLLKGAANRFRMYSHILLAAWFATSPQFQFGRLTPRIRFLSILMTVIFAATLALNQAQALALIQLEDLVSINLEGVLRVLVVDQETTSIPDLLTAESSRQKLLNLPELDISPLKLPPLDLPILADSPGRPEKPEWIQGVALSLEKVRLDDIDHQFNLRLAGDPDPSVTYRLIVVTSSGVSRSFSMIPRVMGHEVKSSGVVIDLVELDDPFLIAIALEAELGGEIQRSGWTLILFPDWIP
jgi:hypothetical protein